MNERKTTDIILELESKINQVLGYLRNLDLHNKLILDRLNQLTKTSQVTVTSANVFTDKTIPFDLTPKETAAGSPPIFPEFKDIPPLISQEEEELIEIEKSPLGSRRGTRVQNPDKKVPIQQRITYQDEKNVCMAKVEVFDLVGNIVTQTRTNQNGKWLAALSPGDYKISIIKAATTTKPLVELNYQIFVPYSDDSIELETKKI